MPVLNLFNSVVRGANTAISGITGTVGSVVGVLDPKMGRLIKSGLNPGGKSVPRTNLNKTNTSVSFSGLTEATDWRVKLSVGAGSNIFYDSNNPGDILAPLKESRGVIFPYSPRIDTVLQANYQEYDLVHTNFPMHAYNKSTISAITISADFTAQTPDEAKYVMAVIHFFRSAIKMFTAQDSLAGNPPAMLFLDGYGENYFPHVPVVLTQFSHSMPDDVDYITAPTLPNAQRNQAGPGELPIPAGASGIRTKIPTISTMTIQLQPIFSRKKVSEFSNEKFSRGEYLNKGYI